MKVNANDVGKLIDEIEILEKDKAKYKELWEKEKAMWGCKWNKLVDLENIVEFMMDYCIQQRRLHRHNHDHCVQKVVSSLGEDNAAAFLNAFTNRLEMLLKHEPDRFELVMQTMNLESMIKG